MAVAIICGAVSCAKEDISSSLAGGEVEVTFTANLPELGTRAYGNAEHINILHYNVYQHGQEEKLAISNVCRDNNNGTFLISIPMIKGMTYDIVFWAENKDCGYYNLVGKELTINYDVDVDIANDENRDAFLATLTDFDPSSAAHPCIVELKRPFAQLNVATSDYETIKKNGIYLTKVDGVNENTDNITSDLKITTQVDTKFNLFTNEVADGSVKQTVTFAPSKMPCASTPEETLINYADYTYLSMNYIFVLSDQETVDVEYNFIGNRATDDSAFSFTKVVIPSVPLKRNYRTNILGKLLTQTADFKVVLEKEFDGELNDDRVFNIFDLQAALEAAPENETTVINLGANIVGNVTDVQKPGRKVVIDGCGCKYNGTIKVHSNSNHYADAALTIKNLNFETSTASVNCIEALENGAQRYSCNITVEDCTFTATGDAVNTAVGVQIKSSKNAKVIGCTATNMHSLIQAQSCDESVLVQGCTVNGKNGVAFKQVKNAVVEGTTITAAEYGIRFDGNTDNSGIVVKNNTVTANQPFIVRKMTGQNNTITLEGANTLTVSAASISNVTPAYQIIITNGSDDEAYVKPTGTYTLTGADNYNIFPEPFPVASWDEFTAALAAGETDIKLTADIEYASNYQLQKSVTLNLGGYSMTLPMINIHTKTTIKNGTINGKVYARKNSEIVFNNVKFSGAVADNLSTEGHLAIQGGCKSLYAKDCLFSPTSVSGSQTKPLSFEGGSTIMKFEGCEFKSSPYKKQVYFNPLSATGSLDFTNCNFNNKTPNIMFAAACPLTNVTMSGTTKLSSVTFEINRAKDVVTDEDLAYLRTLIANNSFSSVRLFYAGGSSEYIR